MSPKMNQIPTVATVLNDKAAVARASSQLWKKFGQSQKPTRVDGRGHAHGEGLCEFGPALGY